MPLPGINPDDYPILAEKLGLSVPSIWDLASDDDEAATAISVLTLLRLSELTELAPDRILGIEAPPRIERMTADQFCARVRSKIAEAGETLEEFENRIGWGVAEALEAPGRLLEIFNWDGLCEVAEEAGVDPWALLPEPRSGGNYSSRHVQIRIGETITGINHPVELGDLESSIWVDCSIRDCDLSGAAIMGSVFSRCRFEDVSLYWGHGFQATFIDCLFFRTDLRAAFEEARFVRCRFEACEVGDNNLGGKERWRNAIALDCEVIGEPLPIVAVEDREEENT